MNDQEFAQKVDYEGGIYLAIFGYGMSAEWLDDHDSPLYHAVKRLDTLKPEIEEIVRAIYDAMPSVEWDEDYD